MPFMLVLFLYIVLEGLAFAGIANLIGLGWTLLLLLATMLFGMTIASLEVRRIMHGKTTRTEDGSVIMEDATPGRTAGNVGLTLAGGVLLSLPGFLTTFLGILLILPPTRALLRTLLSVKLFKSVENMGVRFYDASPMSSQHDSYGSFGTFGAPSTGNPGTASTQPSAAQEREVIDEDEIRNWSQSLSPEDFGGNGGNGSNGTDGSSRGK
ncbi:FxsA family protein [Corynebacterium sp. J010B-136]|uniref:FxsA family protein n=1 Tax=Corynebacterium sp. J010B-136 TaxID=2099401 RepID=UPI000CF889E3|nr:FxsA family protein [Corynebacterium sp. J010B-136]PQM73689.1 exclusion protein FxsA [Corynebacterium sp. J010B-136]